jgi:hypothetical protein
MLYQLGQIDDETFLRDLIDHTVKADEQLNARLRKLARLNAQVTAIYCLLNLEQPSLHEFDSLGRSDDDEDLME